MLAVHCGRKDIAALLIDFGADVKAVDDEGAAPLHWAANGKNRDCINLLIAYGADPDQPNLRGHSPRLVDGGLHMPPGLKKMTPLPPKPEAERLKLVFTAAAAEGDSARVNQMLAQYPGAARWQESCSGMTALFNAAYYRRLPAGDITRLIDKGADVNAQEFVSGWSPLMGAVCRCEPNAAVAALLKANADPFLKNGKGETAMDVASLNDSPDAQKLKNYAIGRAARMTQKPITTVKRFALKAPV
jgi:ankyrin repeat protein